ncbi:MAG TPA: hypothetical protein VMS71_07620, partial [Candidatus Acidoferrum sp.]|nr:hypothetical protein [Candidatus Acidoferrum sp.]
MTKRQLIFILVLLLNLSVHVYATAVRYEGINPIDRAALDRRVSQLRVSPAGAADSVAVWLVADGYLDAQAATQSDTVVVDAGPLCRLASVRESQDSAVLITVNLPFTRENLEGAVNKILDRYQLRGNYYAHATVSEVHREENDITILVSVAPGPVVRVAGNLREGLVRTRPKVLDRYLAVHVGDTLTDSTLRVAERAAAEIPFVNFAPPVTVVSRAGYTDADLEYRFTEKKQFTFLGGMGYLPNDRTGLVWNLNIKATNLFGDGREFSIISERRELGRDLLNVSYGQPSFLLGLGWFNVSIATRDYRDQFYEFGADISYKSRITSHLTLGTALGWKRVDPANDQPSYRRFTAEFALTREAFDDRINPRRGGSIHAALTYAYRTYQADSLAFG